MLEQAKNYVYLKIEEIEHKGNIKRKQTYISRKEYS